jgi:hypothetical protein
MPPLADSSSSLPSIILDSPPNKQMKQQSRRVVRLAVMQVLGVRRDLAPQVLIEPG